MKLDESNIGQAFAMYNTDGRGGLNIAEFAAMTKDIQLKLTDGELVESFETFELDVAREISFDKFAKIIFPDKVWTDAEILFQTKRTVDSTNYPIQLDSGDELTELEVSKLVTDMVADRLKSFEARIAALIPTYTFNN